MKHYKPINYEMGHRYGWEWKREERLRNIRHAAKVKIPHLIELEAHSGHCAIVGAAPSVAHHLDEIRAIQKEHIGCVISINGAHRYLIENGIIPNIHLIWEFGQEDISEPLHGEPHKDVTYYLCSHCHPNIFYQLKDYRRCLWHFYDDPPEYINEIIKLYPGQVMVAGGFVTFFRSINIAIILGFRKFELFGCDCSFDEKTHLDIYETTTEPELLVSTGPDDTYRKFKTNPSLSFLADEFMSFCDAQQHRLSLRVHGDSLLRCLHHSKYPEQYAQGA